MNEGTPHIQYLKRHQIDTGRWDLCIQQSANQLIYAHAFYLDHMAEGQWDALVLNDYEAVMPIPWRRKWGLRYACQPAFTQQLGVFGSSVSPSIVDPFLDRLQTHIRLAELDLNYQNPKPGLTRRVNFILSLDAPYEQLAANYKKDLVRNLKLANTLDYLQDISLEETLDSYREHYASRLPYFRPADYKNFGRICRQMQQQGQLLLRAAVDPQGQILATALLLRDAHRLYLLQSTTLPAGRKKEANHFLLDRLIQEWAGSRLVLDFEGSEQPGIAHFYANFGSIDQPYFFFRHNNLPWPVRLFKR
ncbi:MAG: GNAT family N-acetyltransferase [Bacteroidetes bacterium]|nr:GNAT family N-acetyltransferase [Bacteroidota bacterium]